MRVTREFSRLSNAVTDFGYSVKDSFTGLFAKDPVEHAANVVERAAARKEAFAEAAALANQAREIRKDAYVAVEESGAFGRALKKVAGTMSILHYVLLSSQ